MFVMEDVSDEISIEKNTPASPALSASVSLNSILICYLRFVEQRGKN